MVGRCILALYFVCVCVVMIVYYCVCVCIVMCVCKTILKDRVGESKVKAIELR